jgi:hypothetical protein
MADIKLADFLRYLNGKYDARLKYPKLYMDVIAGDVPAERDPTGRFWLIDEADEPRIAKFYGLIPIKPKPAAKPKPSTRPRTARSAA